MSTGSVPADLARALEAEQRRLGAGQRAEANARALGAGARVVVTGQQAGLLGGPLLALHKAAGAVTLARAEAARTGERVVPVFWIASEDHDWGEVNRATVLDAGGALRDLRLDLAGDLRSVRDVPIAPAEVEALLAALAAALPATERGAEAVRLARPAGEGPTDLGTWFGTLLARWLGDLGLVLVEPHVLAPWAGAVFADLAVHAEVIARAIGEEGARRRAQGLVAPLDPAAGAAPFFLRETAGGPRRRPPLEPDRRALGELLRSRPDLASGDVVGRVFLQNALLPVTHLVAGPTEAAYLAQVAAAHRVLGRTFPTVVARPSATWVERRVRDALEASGTSVLEACEGRAVPPSAPPPDPGVARAHERLRAAARDLAAAARAERARATGVEEDAPTAVDRAVEAAERELARGVERHAQDVANATGRGRARFERALASLRPKGEPQERVLHPLSLVARHGLDALRAGLAELEPGAPHRLLELP